jgi:unsaturated rhamnogalacturonyl hydrolase
VDHNVYGIVPFQLYLQTKDAKYLEHAKPFADSQWSETTPDGISVQARYWIDDMYMIPALQVQAFRATGDKTYLERAAMTMAAYLDRLQQPNGLFHHAPDSPYFWGRGNGWFAAGVAELLKDLPADNPHRARIVAGAQKMAAELLKHQTAEGMWRQLIDKPSTWPETSGTAMFAFCMVRGVKDGWLPKSDYAPAARKAWLALVGYLEADGTIREVCVGTNKGFSEQYYMDRPRKTGDLHGQAPLLWTAAALIE